MKTFAISFLLFCFTPLSLSAPIPHGQLVHARHATKDDSTVPFLNPQNTALTGLWNGGALDILAGKYGHDGHETMESFLASWQKLVAGHTANYDLGTETVELLLDYFLHGRRESSSKHYRRPSLTAETPLPTTELMRLSAEYERAKSPPLPSAPTIVPSWIEALQPGEKGENEDTTENPQPTATVGVYFPSHGGFVKKKLLPHVPKVTKPPVITKARLNEAITTFTSSISLDYSVLMEHFGPEITVLSVFILVPISVLIVEAIEIVWRRWSPERFPRRGRGRLRLTGEERQLQAWSNWKREKILSEKSQHWWKRSRRSMGRKHACNFSN